MKFAINLTKHNKSLARKGVHVGYRPSRKSVMKKYQVIILKPFDLHGDCMLILTLEIVKCRKLYSVIHERVVMEKFVG